MTCHFSLCKWASWEHNVSLKCTSRGKAYRHMLIFEKVNYSSKVICAETECLNSSSDFFTWKDQIATMYFSLFFSPIWVPCLNHVYMFVHQYWIGEICSCCSHWQYLSSSGYWKKFWSSGIIATSGDDKEKQNNPFVMFKTLLSLAS